jgi:hypothetical protein
MDPLKTERDVEQWLDAALSQYGKAEPRTGLESRVLANLRVERNRNASRGRWWWAAGAAAALALILVALWVGESGRERSRTSTMRASTTRERKNAHSLAQPPPQPKTAEPARDVARYWPAHSPIHDPAAKTPKLDQFPSRRNMSEWESLLVRRLSEQSNKEALLKSTPSSEEIDLSIGSLEIRPLQIPDVEISESKTN